MPTTSSTAATSTATSKTPAPSAATPSAPTAPDFSPTPADARAAIAATHWGHLAILREDGTPTIRPIGSFAPAATGPATDVYFSTPRDSAKARALSKNPTVNFYFEPPAADISAYKALSLVGHAEEVPATSADYPAAVDALCAKSPFFKARVEAGGLAATAIYRIHSTELRYSDYARAHRIAEIPAN